MPTPPTGADEPLDVSRLCDALCWTARVLEGASRETERRLGVTGAQLLLLRHLETAPSFSIQTLADLTQTDQSTVSVVVNRLVRRRLVKKSRARADARRVEVTLTRAGARVLLSAREMLRTPLVRAVGQLLPADRDSMTRGLTELVASFDGGDLALRMPIAAVEGRLRTAVHA